MQVKSIYMKLTIKYIYHKGSIGIHGEGYVWINKRRVQNKNDKMPYAELCYYTG